MSTAPVAREGRSTRRDPGPPAPSALVGWWLIGLLAQLAGAAGVVGVGMAVTGQPATTFIEGVGMIPVALYIGAHWAFMAVAGAAVLSPPSASRGALLARLGLRPVGPVSVLTASLGIVGLTLCLSAALTWLDLVDAGAMGGIRRALHALDGGAWLALALTLSIAPALGEELFFRGLLLRGLHAGGPAVIALGGSSLLFAVTHLDLVQGVCTFLLGLFVGWAVLRTGSLLTAVVAHAVNNAAATGLVMGGAELEPVVRLAVGMPLAVGAVVALGRGPRAPKSEW